MKFLYDTEVRCQLNLKFWLYTSRGLLVYDTV